MGVIDETQFVERQQFFDGEVLFAADLQDLEAFNREMRWLHNRSLHQPGIGNGFAVSGQKDDRQVSIGPGYALDDLGREIVLTRQLQLPVPPVSGEPDGTPVSFDLAVSYPADGDLDVAETRRGRCDTFGAVRLIEQPVLCWVRLVENEDGQLVPVDPRLAQDITSGRRIVLARIEVQDCKLKRKVSTTPRRTARPPQQPVIACGDEQPAWALVWLLDEAALRDDIANWLAEDAGTPAGPALLRALSMNESTLSLRATAVGFAAGPMVLPIALGAAINTCAGRFATTPCYNARLTGTRVAKLNLVTLAENIGLLKRDDFDGDLRDKLDQGIILTYFIDGSVRTKNPTPGSFDVEVALIVQLLKVDSPLNADNIKTLQDYLSKKKEDLEIVKDYRECLKSTGATRVDCLKDVVAKGMTQGEELFRKWVVPSDWAILWMGVEE
jgi:hypothetical protein